MEGSIIMNIAFFLLPKTEVMWLTPNSTVRQALERMEYHRYTAVPLLDGEGRYAGTITEGDLLWCLKNTPDLSFERIQKLRLSDVPQRVHNQAVHIDAQMKDLISLAVSQNFVPVIDDQHNFIGIIRRREIMEYCSKLMLESSQREEASTMSTTANS
jgi:CBS-domain-containing membrane protein